MDDQLPRYFVFLATLPLRGLRYLTLHNCEISSTVLSPVPPVLLPLVDLELLDCYVASPGYSAAPLDLRNVRRLWIEPATVGKNLQSLIPHDLEQLSYRPVRSRDGTDMLFSSPDRPRQWPCPVDSFKPFPRLTFLVLEFVRVDFARFQDIVTSCPNLQHLDLTDSIWLEGGSVLRDSDFPEEGLACALEHVPQLRFLALGYIPFGRNYFFGEPVPHVLQTACRQREIDFRWQRAALSDGGSGSSAYRDDHFGFEHQDPDEDPSGQSNEGVADRAPQVSRNSLPSPSPSASSAWSFAGPDDSTADSTNRYRLWNLPRVDRNPLDADDAPSAPASLVDGQEYVEREADEPRLEEGFQAREDEEGLEEEAEPWREWADASDVAEADRMWREFDDGGAGEVVVSSP
ncbi:uncharacterized protein JCM10292_002554 [Rhodotorula paludigena]|uniref:uncharacterized protein n=1 Tax=Rhodotorula paludigena TaxID=86838 RepID=UPI00317844FC